MTLLQTVGFPIPFDDHAVSVSLPLWEDVVGYEEGHPRVVNAMKLGYPRFKIHLVIERLIQHLNEKYSTNYPGCTNLFLPTIDVAHRLLHFMKEVWILINLAFLPHNLPELY